MERKLCTTLIIRNIGFPGMRSILPLRTPKGNIISWNDITADFTISADMLLSVNMLYQPLFIKGSSIILTL